MPENDAAELNQRNSYKIVASIPCFNTEPYIADIVSATRKYVDQVIVIDDGSSDTTSESARKAGACIIHHGRNKGYGEAIKSCFKGARDANADILVILDGDGQHKPDEIPRLIAPILRGEADLTIGSRFGTERVDIPPYRRFGIRVITAIFNLGSRTKVSDAQSGFRAYSRKIFASCTLSERGMSVSIETLEKARHMGAIIKETPVSCSYTPSRLNLKAVRHGLGVALATARIRLHSYRRRLPGRKR